ncbi:hypothetical protein M8J77_013868 [Diaphorina citri]|nr:hypothetical protein M8J77_013868 [Diaphorina citri]
MINEKDDTGDSMTVRGCALDSGTPTTDTELIRMSHCGGFYFDDRYVRGCVQSCDDADACNSSTKVLPSLFHWTPSILRSLHHQVLFSCVVLQILHYGIT